MVRCIRMVQRKPLTTKVLLADHYRNVNHGMIVYLANIHFTDR